MGGDAFIPKPAGADRILTVLGEISSRPDRRSSAAAMPKSLDVMKHYSELLVKKLEEQLSQARNALSEKEALLKEIHHRVKNNLQVISSLLRLESARSTHPETGSVLLEMQARIQSMSLLHETLYRSPSFAFTDLGKYLGQVAKQTFHALSRSGQREIELQLDLESVEVEMDQAIPCGLILNELISNCLKHAFPDDRPGKIEVRLRRQGPRRSELIVRDSGNGLSPDVEARMRASLGLQLVSDLARQVGGEVAMESSERGSQFRVTLST